MKLSRLGGYYSYSGESWLWFKEIAMEITAKMDLRNVLEVQWRIS